MRQLSLMLLLACAACSAAGPAAAPAPATSVAAVPPAPATSVAAVPPATTTPAQMRALVGAAACTETAQCKTVPLGARACGGPEGYLAYSSVVTPSAQLQALAARYAEQQRAANATSGMASTCQFVVDPGAECRAGACVLGSNGGNVR